MVDHKPTKTWRRILPAVSIACIALALLLILTWTQRPRWHTYTFPANPDTGIAVAIDYPEDWRIEPTFSPEKVFSSGMYVTFVPLPPTGLARWWMEKVLRQDINNADNNNIQISVCTGIGHQDMAVMEKEIHDIGSQALTIQQTHTMHTLGPMLDASITIPPQIWGTTSKQKMRIHGVIIYPSTKTEASKYYISAATVTSSLHFPRFNAALTAMIPRIHLVKSPVPAKKSPPVFNTTPLPPASGGSRVVPLNPPASGGM
jgi:hypothetical protein